MYPYGAFFDNCNERFARVTAESSLSVFASSNDWLTRSTHPFCCRHAAVCDAQSGFELSTTVKLESIAAMMSNGAVGSVVSPIAPRVVSPVVMPGCESHITSAFPYTNDRPVAFFLRSP